MILEGIVTTLHADQSPNVSPMGPIVDPNMNEIVLRPFPSSRTYRNLQRHGAGVFHVTDDVELLARAAVNQLDPLPPTRPAPGIRGVILSDACRWYAFRVEQLRLQESRARIVCRVVQRGRQRDFVGFNRAKHAVLEAAILATRLDLLPAEQIEEQLRRLAPLVEKTAGPQEQRAFAFLERYCRTTLGKL